MLWPLRQRSITDCYGCSYDSIISAQRRRSQVVAVDNASCITVHQDPSLDQVLPHCDTHSLITATLTASLRHSLPHCLEYPLAASPTGSHTHWLPHPLAASLTGCLTHLLPHSLAPIPTRCLLTDCCVSEPAVISIWSADEGCRRETSPEWCAKGSTSSAAGTSSGCHTACMAVALPL